MKYNGDGDKQWTRQLGSSAIENGRGIATDAGGNIYVAGFTFGALDGNTSAGAEDLFVVKYNGAGEKQWTRQLGSSSYDDGIGSATDASGNVYVTGFTNAALDGNSSAGSDDLFLVKYNSAGQKQWTRQFGSSSGDGAWGIATDASSNVYVTGYTAGALDGNTSAGNSDMFVVKYDDSGNRP